MAGRTQFWRVVLTRICKELFHPIAVRDEPLRNVRFRPRRLGKPPNRVNSVLGPDLSLVYPFDRTWQTRGIMPVKILCKMKALLVAHSNQKPKVVQAPAWDSKPFVGATLDCFVYRLHDLIGYCRVGLTRQ